MSKQSLLRRFGATTGWLSLAAVSVGIVIAVGAASASGASAHASGSIPVASGTMKTVVVVLRNTAGSAGPHSAVRQNALRTEEGPLAQALRTAGATHVTTGSAIPVITAKVSAAQQAALAANPAVRAVFPNQTIHLGAPMSAKSLGLATPAVTRGTPRSFNHSDTPSVCGTADNPEQDPEALSVINAPSAWNLGYDGAGVTVGYIAGHIPTDIPDFNRNAAYGTPGDPVVTEENFSGDPSGDQTGDIEALLDAASIASQGNTTYDLSQYVNTAHPTPSSPCDIKITGAAPGANVVGFDVFSNDYYTTNSNFVQAIDYAVLHGVNVLNESFGSNPFPDTALDAVKMADDYAISEGVTVVVSSGDAGVTNTDGSPATDPNVISVGASTTFRSYQQEQYGASGFSNGTWIDNNISSISSGGFSQSGGNT